MSGIVRPSDAIRLRLPPYEKGRVVERAAIVAWLRLVVGKYRDRGIAAHLDTVADHIERGKHMMPGDPD